MLAWRAQGRWVGYHWHPGAAAEWEVPQTWEGQPASAGSHGPAKAPQLRGPLVVGLRGPSSTKPSGKCPDAGEAEKPQPHLLGQAAPCFPPRPDAPGLCEQVCPKERQGGARGASAGRPAYAPTRQGPGLRTSWCETLKKVKWGLMGLDKGSECCDKDGKAGRLELATASILDGSPSGGPDGAMNWTFSSVAGCCWSSAWATQVWAPQDFQILSDFRSGGGVRGGLKPVAVSALRSRLRHYGLEASGNVAALDRMCVAGGTCARLRRF